MLDDQQLGIDPGDDQLAGDGVAIPGDEAPLPPAGLVGDRDAAHARRPKRNAAAVPTTSPPIAALTTTRVSSCPPQKTP